MLQDLGKAYGVHVSIVSLVEAGVGGIKGQVSSSKIRAALNEGHMQQVAESLGRPYRLLADISPEIAHLDLESGKVRSLAASNVRQQC